MHRNKVYGHADWARHKSSWRHGRHLSTILKSGVIHALGPPVILCTLLAVVVSLHNHTANFRHSRLPLLQVATLPFTLTAPVLALLLVFRTNSSYQRFDEARKAWGSTVNRSRDLARQALTWIRNPAGDTPRILRFIKAFPVCLQHHLTAGGSLEEDLATVLDLEERDSLMSASNHPIYVLQFLSEIINQCNLPDWERIAMDKNLTQFHDNVGACERIFKTPIPIAYTRLTSRVLLLWHMVLPFALWESCGWLTIPVTFMSSAALFYIEEVGVLIEEPFWILALAELCKGVGQNVDGLNGAHKEAAMLLWSANTDHVLIDFGRAAKEDSRARRGDVNIVLSRMNSMF